MQIYNLYVATIVLIPMIAQKTEKERLKVCIVCIFFVYICSQKVCVCNRYRQDDQQKRKKQKGVPSAYIRSPVASFLNCYFVHDCYVLNFFFLLLVILSPPISIEAVILVDHST